MFGFQILWGMVTRLTSSGLRDKTTMWHNLGSRSWLERPQGAEGTELQAALLSLRVRGGPPQFLEMR